MHDRSPVLHVLAIVAIALFAASCGGPGIGTPSEEPDAGTYDYGEPVALTEDLTDIAGDGFRVIVPGLAAGSSGFVQWVVSEEMVGGERVFPARSRVVALRFSDVSAFAGPEDDVAPVLSVQLDMHPSGAATQVSTSDAATMPVAAWVGLRTDDGPWTRVLAQAVWDDDVNAFVMMLAHPLGACMDAASGIAASCEMAWQLVDLGALIAAEDSLDGQALDARGAGRLAAGPHRAGLHRVDLSAFATAGATCDAALATSFTHRSEQGALVPEADTAVVFVHGWLTLAGLFQWNLGDTLSTMPEHCHQWEPLLAAAASATGPYAVIRNASDVYTFRYNSNRRVAISAAALAAEVRGLEAAGYERVVLVGHSMGGLVIHDARARLLADAAVPLGAADMPVVTLGTPYMGGPLGCTVALAGVCQAVHAATLFGTVSAPVVGMDSTLDLASALTIPYARLFRIGHVHRTVTGPPVPLPYVRNPYLLALWQDVDLSDPSVTAFVGRSDVNPFYGSNMYVTTAALVATGWGANDGIVPLASARASTALGGSNPAPRLPNRIEVGRDHGFVAKGCMAEDTERPCPVGGLVGDPHLDVVAQSIAGAARPPKLTVTPGGVAGTVPEGVVISQNLMLTNAGAVSLTVQAVTPTASWVRASPTVVTSLDPGSSATVEVTLDASGLSAANYTTALEIVWAPTVGAGTAQTLQVPVTFAVTAPASNHRLFGLVTDGTGTPLSGVVTSVEINGVPFAATTDLDGRYDFTFYKGTLSAANARIAKLGYESILRSVDFTAASQTELDAVLVPISSSDVLYYEGFENCAPNWSIDNAGGGMWNCRGTEAIQNKAYVEGYVNLVAGDTTNGFVPTPYTGSHAFWYGDPTTGNFIGEQQTGDGAFSGGTSTEPNQGRFVSPSFDLSGESAARLEGMTWYEVESVDIAQHQFDQMRVNVYVGNPLGAGTLQYTRWINPPFEPPLQQADLPYTSGGNNRPALWVPFAVDLTPVAGTSDVYIVFEFTTVDGAYNGYRGWLLDELYVLSGAGPAVAPSMAPMSVPSR